MKITDVRHHLTMDGRSNALFVVIETDAGITIRCGRQKWEGQTEYDHGFIIVRDPRLSQVVQRPQGARFSGPS